MLMWYYDAPYSREWWGMVSRVWWWGYNGVHDGEGMSCFAGITPCPRKQLTDSRVSNQSVPVDHSELHYVEGQAVAGGSILSP